MAHNIHPKIINLIAKIYVNDATNLFLNKKQCAISITNGIQQGCNGSTLLFLLLTYEIIERLQMANTGFRNQLFKIAILYYADDGLMLAHTINEAKESIKLIQSTAQDYRLITETKVKLSYITAKINQKTRKI